VRNATDLILAAALPEAAVLMRRGLADLAMWSWDDETKKFVASVPVPFWLRRVMPIHSLFSVEGQPGDDGASLLEFQPDASFDVNQAHRLLLGGLITKTEIVALATRLLERDPGLTPGLRSTLQSIVAGGLTKGQMLAAVKRSAAAVPSGITIATDSGFQKILAGKLSKPEALDIIRELEFGSPTPEQLNAILDDVAWPDGLNAMERIVTVPTSEIEELRRKINEHLALPGADSASALSDLANDIGDLVDNVNFKAVRIARTEGTRVAEDMLRETWKEADEFIEGIQVFTANDENVRPTHVKNPNWRIPRHGKIYRKQRNGSFRADDGEPLPRFPEDPNCRCWDTPVMIPEIEREIANVTVGPEYRAALDRFERERA
jgi:hypothetical protein